MKAINFGRVILGGLLAGIVVNISEFVLNTIVLKSEMEAGMKALGKTVPQSGGAIAVWTVLGFAIGIVSVWLYAAIRPRYGAGPATAVAWRGASGAGKADGSNTGGATSVAPGTNRRPRMMLPGYRCAGGRACTIPSAGRNYRWLGGSTACMARESWV